MKTFKIKPGIIASKLDIKDGDNILITVDLDRYDIEDAQNMLQIFSKNFPNNKVIITFKGIEVTKENKNKQTVSPNTWDEYFATPIKDKMDSIPIPCRSCSNHPINGGYGICNCTLGTNTIMC